MFKIIELWKYKHYRILKNVATLILESIDNEEFMTGIITCDRSKGKMGDNAS